MENLTLCASRSSTATMRLRQWEPGHSQPCFPGTFKLGALNFVFGVSMTKVDRLIQTWRIKKACRFIPDGARVLDIGCADGALFGAVPSIREGIGIDPRLDNVRSQDKFLFVRGLFPADLPDQRSFDVIIMLAVLEHIPHREQNELAINCARYLNPGGRLIITVPAKIADGILTVLKGLRLIHGMSLEEHYGYDVNQTPAIFRAAGLVLVRRERFQLGVNNLFVFQRS
ncbi:MAG: class I SAM-dependent methyltransferase [Candidatus Acidiferrales bacterium]